MGISTELVKKLRESTGLPMMECKNALQEAEGDVENAKEILRKKGKKIAEGKAARKANEGRVGGYMDPSGKGGILLALKCETEPVAKCRDFLNLHKEILEAMVPLDSTPQSKEELLNLNLPSGKPVQERLEEVVGKIRENVQVGDFAILRGDAVFQYVHFDNRHASMVQLGGADPSGGDIQELGKNLCMHVVFAKPKYLSREDVPEEALEKEMEILLAATENDPKLSKKPLEIRKKIVEGKLNRFYSDNCLLQQPFVKDEKVNVQKHVSEAGKGATLENYSYVGLV